MERSYGRNTERAQAYVTHVGEALSPLSPSEIAKRINRTVAEHDYWRDHEAISLNAAENVLSKGARALLDSDLATRVTEGFPGDKDFPAHAQNRFVDEIEASIIFMLKRQFDTKHVEWRPVSTSMANATVFFAMTDPGDVILVQPEAAGGNYSYNMAGPPRAARLDVRALPFLEESFEVHLERAVETIRANEPKLIAIGGSNVLFPYPVRELKEVAEEVGATLLYDAAHIALLCATGLFQDPLGEGADIMTFSSHKIMSGPVGGVILTNDDVVAERILPYSFPTLVQTRDQNKFAAFAYALAEMSEYGAGYARQMVSNARALGAALEAEGFELLGSNRGYTQTHQIFMFISDEDSEIFEEACQRSNLLVTRAQRMGAANRPAVRLTTQEITRRGMTEDHMPVLAGWLRRVILERERPEAIADELRDFITDFPVLQFSFDSGYPGA